jgi:DNA-binding beta-propeller fold protein YncE
MVLHVRLRLARRPRCGVVVATCILAALLVTLPAVSAFAAKPDPTGADTREVLFVANNWDGTAHLVDPQTFDKLDRINVIPDKQQRVAEISRDPLRLAYFLAIRQFVGEGNDQYVDDMFSSPDGRFAYVSRPSFADVVAIDLRTHQIRWRVPVDGYRSDHMAITRDGSRLLVSASTARKVHVIDPLKGRIVGEFPSGDSPHENNFSSDEGRIFHASIGHVFTPADQPELDSTKGDRWFQVVDANTLQVTKRLDIGQILRKEGFGNHSSAVRPMAIAPGDRIFYLQLSFLHGFVEFDVEEEKPLRIARLPKRTTEPRENYLLDSAHHGLNIGKDKNGEYERLCAAGTMDNYAAIVNRSDFSHQIIPVGEKPYWSTNNADDTICFVSVSGNDRVSAISYASGQEVDTNPDEPGVNPIDVGDHPQRMRMGKIRADYLP